MQRGDHLTHTVPAMRILENEHRYLTYLMDEWHHIVLGFANRIYDLEYGKQQLEHLRNLLIAFKEPLSKHIQKEERHFFPLLGNYIGFDQGPLVSIEQEHEEIISYLDHFLHFATEDDLTFERMCDISGYAGEAYEVLMIHFVKEESVLFPMVERVMNAEDQASLSK